MTDTTSPPDAYAVASRMNELSPRLSPVVVKELRQGLRTNLFTICFILLQAFMILCLMLGLVSTDTSAANAFFWFFIISIALIVQPLRGLTALSSEYQLNTMDLIQLTHLTGWRITLGKWVALNAQTGLFIAGILPYLVIRYFLGNVEFISDLVMLGFVCLSSALATSVAIGLSALRSLIVRFLLTAVFATPFISFTTFILSFSHDLEVNPEALAVIGLVTLATFYGCFFFLSFGASRISPLSENHATRKRFVTITCALLTVPFAFTPIDTGGIVAAAGFILGLGLIDALTEPPPLYARVMKPFRKNFLTRLVGIFFSPGWVSGNFYFLLSIGIWFLIIVTAGVIAGDSLMGQSDGLSTALILPNLIALPVIFIHLLFRHFSSSQYLFGLYFFIQLGLSILTVFAAAGAGIMGAAGKWIPLLLPLPSVLLVSNVISYGTRDIGIVISLVTLVLIVVVPMLCRWSHFKTFFQELSARRSN